MKILTQITSERLIIRRFIPDDINLFKRFMQDNEATRYLNFTDEQKSPEAITALFENTIAEYDKETANCVLAIALAESNEYIGLLGGKPLETEGEFEIFYNLLPEHWGRGYAAEAVTAFLNYMKAKTPYNKAVAYIHLGNTASIKLAERMGMTDEGEVIHDGHASKRYTYPIV
jgi:[ribosomal protein S5]-alanine N-acetyltransferase